MSEKIKVLIVDDYPENVRALEELIANNDIEIFSASTGEQALYLMTQHEFGLALLDVQMPVMSGFELARLIRGVKRFRNIPIIFITAEPESSGTVLEGYDSGAIDLIFKPVNPHVVRSKVRAFIEMFRQSKLLEKQLSELNRLKVMADVANMAKSQFLANMSHEIRTPLAAVLGYSELLAQPNLTKNERDEFSTSIARNGELLLRLIDDILDFSRIEANRLELENINFDFNELLEEVNSTLRFKAEEKGIALSFEAPKLPSHYSGDPIRIKQALLNIVGNAIKFTSKGKVSVTVRFEGKACSDNSEKECDDITFIVEDQGVGMDKCQIANLFQPFGQGDASMKRKFGGSGLGLVISKQIANAYYGDIRVIKSEPGVGSIFELKLQLERSAEKAAGAQQHSDAAVLEPIKAGDFSGKKALVVDDSPDNLRLIELFLRNTDLQMTFAETGQEALERAKQNDYDLVLLDVQMPDMDGYQVTRELRNRGLAMPIIAVTAHAMKEDHDACLAAGYNTVLVKPLNRSLLVQTLQQHLQ